MASLIPYSRWWYRQNQTGRRQAPINNLDYSNCPDPRNAVRNCDDDCYAGGNVVVVGGGYGSGDSDADCVDYDDGCCEDDDDRDDLRGNSKGDVLRSRYRSLPPYSNQSVWAES